MKRWKFLHTEHQYVKNMRKSQMMYELRNASTVVSSFCRLILGPAP